MDNPFQDTPRSWVVACACAWNFFWLTLVNRSAGVMFVCIKDEFGLSRQEASWGFSLMDTLSSFTVIVCSVLYRFFDTRSISITGVIMVAAGFFFCTAVYHVTVVTVVFGVIVGFGQGMMYFSNAITINQYFKQYRASGNGIYFAGGTLGSFFIPPILFQVVEAYGLRATFLFLGGLALNGLAASLLLKSPLKMMKKRQKQLVAQKEAIKYPDKDNGHVKENGHIITNKSVPKVLIKNGISPVKPQNDHNMLPGLMEKQKGAIEWLLGQARQFKFLSRPIFAVIALSGIAFSFSFVIYPVTIVDFAIGRGLSKSQASLLLATFSIGDLTGRLITGAVSDRKYIQRDQMMACIYFVWGVSFIGLPLAQGYEAIVSVSIVLGFAIGSGTPMYTVLLAEYLGIQVMPTTFGIYRLILGIVSLARPITIGYFRDRKKSYDELYYLLGIYAMFICLIWVLTVICSRRGKKASFTLPS